MQTTTDTTSKNTADGRLEEHKGAVAKEAQPTQTLSGYSAVLWKAGQQIDDPDPERVSRWIVRANEEGVL